MNNLLTFLRIHRVRTKLFHQVNMKYGRIVTGIPRIMMMIQTGEIVHF